MECPTCKIDFGDAEHCPTCTWTNEQTGTSSESVSGDIFSGDSASMITETPRVKEKEPESETGNSEFSLPEEFNDKDTKIGDQLGILFDYFEDPELNDSDSAFKSQVQINNEGNKGIPHLGMPKNQYERSYQSKVRVDNEGNTIGAQIGAVKKLYWGSQSPGNKQTYSIYPDTYTLSREDVCLPDFILEEQKMHLSTLKDKHILVIGCADPKFAFHISFALIDALQIFDSEQRRIYDVEERPGEDIHISMRSFLRGKKSGKKRVKRVALIVNASRASEPALVNTVLDNTTASERLRDDAVYLLFLVNPAYLDEQLNDKERTSDIPHWKVPYLQHLLREKYPEDYLFYEQQIRTQAKKWHENEKQLCREVSYYLEIGELPAEIRRREELAEPSEDLQSIFKGEQCIEKTILYVATYFPDVTPSEFCELVEALLGDRKMSTTIPKLIFDDQQTIMWAQESGTREVVEIWKEYKDHFMWQWLRETISAEDNATVIDFKDYSLRNFLRECLGNERKFYLKDQFQILQSKGFLFHPSSRVAKNMIRLTANAATAQPDECKDWLVDVIRRLEDYFESGPNGHQNSGSNFFRFLNPIPFNKAFRGYSRTAELIRQLIKIPQMKEIVNPCLTELMRQGYYYSVFNLLCQLRLVPDFDGQYWLKQVFDRGDNSIRSQAFNYLYHNIREADANISEILNKLESWLPAASREPRIYPQSARFALLLLIRYYMETIYRFHEEGEAGSPEYLLFTYADKESANTQLDQLVRWLLHPAVRQTLVDLKADPRMRKAFGSPGLEKNLDQLLGALLSEWAFISFRLTQTANTEINQSENIKSFEPADDSTTVNHTADLLERLFQKIAANADEEQRRNLIAYWEAYNRNLLYFMNGNLSIEERNQLTWKWNQNFHLIQGFKKIKL